jgi:hypothetical protein
MQTKGIPMGGNSSSPDPIDNLAVGKKESMKFLLKDKKIGLAKTP